VRLRLIRAGYQLAWLGLWLLSPLHRGRGRGVKALLTDGERVLLVQHTYGPRRWELPGGGAHRRETPLEAVRREIREELGVELDEPALLSSARGSGRESRRRMSWFAARIDPAAVAPDPREIARVQWHEPGALPPRLGTGVARAVAAWRAERRD